MILGERTNNVSSTPTAVFTATEPCTIFGMLICPTSGDVTVNVTLLSTDGAVTNLLKNTTILNGVSLAVFGDTKLVLNPDDILKVSTSQDTESVDVSVSVHKTVV